MLQAIKTPSSERLRLIRWTARIGAVTADALAEREQWTIASARARLLGAERVGLLSRHRPLIGQPALYTVTRAGLRAAGIRGLDPMSVSAANARHAIVCVSAAVALEQAYPDCWVMGERELRREERECRAPMASATLRPSSNGMALLHRPDLVLWPEIGQRPPVAVEVELTVKAPRRLLEICRAWSRCRCVSGVLYLASAEVRRPLERALARAQAGERIVLLPLEALTSTCGQE
jgi:hypothetical protein